MKADESLVVGELSEESSKVVAGIVTPLCDKIGGGSGVTFGGVTLTGVTLGEVTAEVVTTEGAEVGGPGSLLLVLEDGKGPCPMEGLSLLAWPQASTIPRVTPKTPNRKAKRRLIYA